MSKQSTMRKTKAPAQAQALLGQNKEQFTVPELAPALAAVLEISEPGARSRIYRSVESGKIMARSYLGSIRIPYAEAARVLRGEDY